MRCSIFLRLGIMMNNYGFFALAFRQKYIKRWGLMRNSATESLSEHACEVAIVAHALALAGNKYFGKNYDPDRIACLSIYHDVPEVYTGDMPTPIKYFNSQSKESYRLVEKSAIESLLCKLPAEFVEDYRRIFNFDCDPEATSIIKAADKICAYIKCLDEQRCGNHDFDSAMTAIENQIKNLNCREAEWFIENVLPSFSMTLDQLQDEG